MSENQGLKKSFFFSLFFYFFPIYFIFPATMFEFFHIVVFCSKQLAFFRNFGFLIIFLSFSHLFKLKFNGLSHQKNYSSQVTFWTPIIKFQLEMFFINLMLRPSIWQWFLQTNAGHKYNPLQLCCQLSDKKGCRDTEI